jgi:hypothetical protein
MTRATLSSAVPPRYSCAVITHRRTARRYRSCALRERVIGSRAFLSRLSAAPLGQQGVFVMKRMLVTATALAALAMPAMAQTTIVTTERISPPLSLAPEQRTMIREYVVERRVPVVRQRIVVGEPIAQEVELQPVPYEWGPQVRQYRYVYADDHVAFVDPGTRRVVQVVE